MLSYFLVIFNRYFPCLLVFLSTAKGFVYSFLDITSYFLVCMELQELMVSGIFEHNFVFHFNETFQIDLLICILMWHYIMQYVWIICSVGLHCCLFCEITKNMQNVYTCMTSTRLRKLCQSGYNIKNAKSNKNFIEQAIFDIPINQVFFIPFLSYQNIVKGCPY